MDSLFIKAGVIMVFFMISVTAAAEDLSRSAPLTDAEWSKLHETVGLLGRVSFFPGLLPVVMKNQDALELTTDQKRAFRSWRKDNYQRMVDLMNEIIEKRIAFSQSALDRRVSDLDLVQEQAEIFRLQKELLVLRLSCRDLILTTFSPNQWNNFAFILEDYPEFAGLIPQPVPLETTP